MKKVSRISLHNLSKAELANNEMNQLRGGSGGVCAVICWGSACRCYEGASGAFETSADITKEFIDNGADKTAWEQARDGSSGA